jgi:hypothetical protein
MARRAAHAREAVGQHATPQVFGELALDVTGQSATFGGGRGIVLTAFGRYFATKATAILDHVAAVLADSKRWSS